MPVRVCRHLKGYCVAHEWAGSAAALLGVGLLLGTVWLGIEYHAWLKAWLGQERLGRGLLLGTGILLDVFLIFGLLCLGFSECSEADRRCVYAYRGRRSTVFPELTGWIHSLGHNPRRHGRPP